MNITADAARKIMEREQSFAPIERLMKNTFVDSIPRLLDQQIREAAELGRSECAVQVVCLPEYLLHGLQLYGLEPQWYRRCILFPYQNGVLDGLNMDYEELRDTVMEYVTSVLTDAGFQVSSTPCHKNVCGLSASAFNLEIAW